MFYAASGTISMLVSLLTAVLSIVNVDVVVMSTIALWYILIWEVKMIWLSDPIKKRFYFSSRAKTLFVGPSWKSSLTFTLSLSHSLRKLVLVIQASKHRTGISHGLRSLCCRCMTAVWGPYFHSWCCFLLSLPGLHQVASRPRMDQVGQVASRPRAQVER